MTASSPTVLLVTNRRLDENVGRAEKFTTRHRLITDHGWELTVGYVDPSPSGILLGVLKNLGGARRADVINSVSNPPELQIAGAILAGLTGTPWLAEFRDPLVTVPGVERRSLRGRFRALLERYILTHADRVVWYDGIQLPDEYFERTYPDVPPDRYRQLPPIGYEQEKFDSIEPATFTSFTITYAGSFYPGWIEPTTFLKGLAIHRERHYADQDELRALFYGDWHPRYDKMAEDLGVADAVVPHEFVPHSELVSVLKGSDVLLYIGGEDPRNEQNLPTKLYDYIGARRPILALVDPSFRAADVIREYDLGIVVNPDDDEAVATALGELRTSSQFDADIPESHFTRERSTGAYVETLEALRTHS